MIIMIIIQMIIIKIMNFILKKLLEIKLYKDQKKNYLIKKKIIMEY